MLKQVDPIIMKTFNQGFAKDSQMDFATLLTDAYLDPQETIKLTVQRSD